MTLTMADSIFPANLPGGYDSYLGYVDGLWPTAALLPGKFPGKPVVSLTVKGGTAVADGCDVENGDLTPQSGAQWAADEIAAKDGRPVIYAGAETMASVLTELAAVKVARASVRLLSAHYGDGEHVCGPATCRQTSITMDGTQWTDAAPGTDGTAIDASALASDFFGTPATDPDPTLRLGATGDPVKTMQGRLNAWGAKPQLAVDGDFGSGTLAAVEAFQKSHALTVDGVCGPETWAALNASPADWTFGAPQELKARGGDTSVELTWKAPAGVPEAPAQYQVYIYRGTVCDVSTIVATYPRTVKGTSHLEGSLTRGKTYTAHVVAEGKGATRVRPFTYSSVTFATG
jgi:peptidoglycan hydrolase-like protein with peptidoglycan-binding domain